MNSVEAKLQYKQKIFKLLGSQDQDPIDSIPIQSNDEFWNCFWDEPESAQDIFNLLTFNDLKLIRDSNKTNFLNWIRVLVIKLINLSNDIKLNPSPIQIKKLLNCIRYLTKIIPFLFEKQDFNKDINHIFWNLSYNNIDFDNQVTSHNDNNNNIANPNSGAATIGSFSTDTNSSQFTNSSTKVRINQPIINSPDSQDVHVGGLPKKTKSLGEQLIHSLVDLLFTRGFTLKKDTSTNVYGVDFKIWEVGIGANGKYSNPNPELDSNRLEILRLILTLSSQGLYTFPKQIVSSGSRFLTVLVATLGKLKILTLICSLLNLVCRSCKSDQELNGLVYKESHYSNTKYQDLRKNFITLALNLLTTMMVYPIPANDSQFIYKLNIMDSNERIHNLVRSYFGRLHKENELNFIFSSFISYLNKPMEQSVENELNPFNVLRSNFTSSAATTSNIPQSPSSTASSTPGSPGGASAGSIASSVTLTNNNTGNIIPTANTNYNSLLPALTNWNMELIIFLWELLQSNKNFKNFIYTKKAPELMIILFFYLKHYKTNPQWRSNLIRIICYFLTYLTSDKIVNSKLIVPINQNYYHNQLPNFYKINNINGNQLNNLTYRDFLIIQICNVLSMDTQDSSTFDPIITPNFFNYLYNLIPVKQSIDSSSGTMVHYKTKNALSYQSSLSIINLVSRLSNNPIFLNESYKLDLLALIIRTIVHSCFRYQSESRTLIYNVVKHEDVFRKLLANIETLKHNEHELNDIQEDDHEDEDSYDEEDGSEQPLDNADDDYFQSGTGHDNNNNDNNNDSNEYNNNNNTNNNSNNDEFEESLRPKPPAGMSSKAKGKLPLDAPLAKTWTGYKALSTLIKFIDFIEIEIPNLGKTSKTEIMENLIKIESLKEYESKISKFSSSEFLNKTKFENLKFIWSTMSLGWYESILWGDVFYQNTYQFNKDSNGYSASNWFNKRNSGLSNLKEVASSWGFNWNSKRSNSSTTPEVRIFEFDQTILQVNIWNGTFIKLFKIQKPIVEKPLVDVNSLMKKLRLNSTSSITTLNTLDSRADSLNSPNQLTPINSRQSFNNTPRNSIHINSRQNSFSNIHESPYNNYRNSQ